MAEEINMEQALEVYDSIINMLDNCDWKYDKDEEDLLVRLSIGGEGLEMKFLILVKPKNDVVTYISPLPFKVPENKRNEVAVAVCVANYGLVSGGFDFDIRDGEIRYRITQSYLKSSLSEELLEKCLLTEAATVRSYMNKFFMLSQGMMTLEQFIEKENS